MKRFEKKKIENALKAYYQTEENTYVLPRENDLHALQESAPDRKEPSKKRYTKQTLLIAAAITALFTPLAAMTISALPDLSPKQDLPAKETSAMTAESSTESSAEEVGSKPYIYDDDSSSALDYTFANLPPFDRITVRWESPAGEIILETEDVNKIQAIKDLFLGWEKYNNITHKIADTEDICDCWVIWVSFGDVWEFTYCPRSSSTGYNYGGFFTYNQYGERDGFVRCHFPDEVAAWLDSLFTDFASRHPDDRFIQFYTE